MKVVILAGGLGTRISEESHLKPKPMITIGEMPILWHIMKIYGQHGLNEFIICLGYKGYVIKEFFGNYMRYRSNMTVHIDENRTEYHETRAEPWKVTMVDTGMSTETGGRIRRVRDYLQDDEPFCMTYGDGLARIDISASIAFHKSHGKLATLSAVKPPGRFGALDLDGDQVTAFVEKPVGDRGYINGGFFVLSPKVIDYIEDDVVKWEQQPLTRLAGEGQLQAYKHQEFWQPMDTLRDRNYLEALWDSGNAPWKVWE